MPERRHQIDHASNHSLFETRLRHQNQKFLGFGQAGIRVGGHHGRYESAEIIYENVIFDSCGLGCTGMPYVKATPEPEPLN